jgi:hypothetical protein
MIFNSIIHDRASQQMLGFQSKYPSWSDKIFQKQFNGVEAILWV